MGFDTYVNIGERTAVSWRKQTGALPRLLFATEDLEVVVDPEGNVVGVVLRSTVARVLANLESNGLGWDATVAAYANVRSGGAAEAMLSGHFMVELLDEELEEDELDRRVERRLAEYRETPPADDLRAFGTVLAAQWSDPNSAKVLLFDELLYDSPIEATSSLIGQAYGAAGSHGQPLLPVARAMETITLLFTEARLVAWPMLMCVLLQHLPSETSIEYSMSGGIFEFGMENEESAREFFDRYWEGAGESVADYSQQLGYLFGALAQFRGSLGSHYWFGRAASALERLDELNADRSTSTNKARGDALEDLVDCILRTEQPDLGLIAKNYRTAEEEIDLVVSNGLPHPFWVAQSSPIILIECKNWADAVGVEPLRVLESKLEDRRSVAKIGIFVSTSGFTGPFDTRLKSVQTRGVGIIFAVTVSDLRGILARRQRLSDWLRTDGVLRALSS